MKMKTIFEGKFRTHSYLNEVFTSSWQQKCCWTSGEGNERSLVDFVMSPLRNEQEEQREVHFGSVEKIERKMGGPSSTTDALYSTPIKEI